EPTALRCVPRAEAFYTPSLDLAFDRNACSLVREQEPLEILARWPNGMALARTRYALGWLSPDAVLSPVVPTELREAVLGSRARLDEALVTTIEGSEARVPAGALLPTGDAGLLVASAAGF